MDSSERGARSRVTMNSDYFCERGRDHFFYVFTPWAGSSSRITIAAVPLAKT